jgi:two-component SAPR family response regulator
MSTVAPKSVVVVDRSRAAGFRLRNCLLDDDATVHVFDAFPPALAMLHRKKIDTVAVEFDTDKATLDFCSEVQSLNVPLVFLSAPIEPFDLREYGFRATFPNLPHAPNLQVQYAHSRTGSAPI